MENESDFEQFRRKLLRLTREECDRTRHYKVLNLKKSFRDLRRKGDKYAHKVTEYQYSQIVIRTIRYLFEDFMDKGRVEIPHLGDVLITKSECKMTKSKVAKSGYKNKRIVNWKETHKLWFEDEESRKKKKLVMFDIPYMYRISFKKRVWKNMNLFSFKTSKVLKKRMYKYITEEGEPFAFKKNEYVEQ